MKKVELLAPAGNKEALLGALAAGADAVYLGGNEFGARAYADNFTQEEIVSGIRLAHLLGKRIYLTVNTLVKEKEFPRLYDFLSPYYEAGLDGVIIQDLGVFHFIKEHFPGMELHVSTQMTITGTCGARYLKEAGAVRIVPARELSLEEIKEIKNKVDIEIEAFIHGAMCYCYSGQCLFSSILGGRSGNRGRCAQPCRLPYRVEHGKEGYPLSMKDMCTLAILPELIEAGIDSFKIEGRMKKPEYAAGVTAMYRKYIDLYYSNPKGYRVAEEDYQYLRSLYIRSGIGEGYYHTHNGKEMITLSSPAYSGSDEQSLSEIRRTYLDRKPSIPVMGKAVLKIGEPAKFELSGEGAAVCVTGCEVQKAARQPLSEEKIREQLLKSGNTCFEMASLTIEADADIFMPVSSLNQLRRDALTALEEEIIKEQGFSFSERKKKNAELSEKEQDSLSENIPAFKGEIHALVNSMEQLEAAAEAGAERIYIDRIPVDEEVCKKLYGYKEKYGFSCYLAFPYIIRSRSYGKVEQLCKQLQHTVFDGALIRNTEALSLLLEKQIQKPVVTDTGVYVWNQRTYEELQKEADEIYLPTELNLHEWKELLKGLQPEVPFSVMVYGRLPMMITANCVRKTTAGCKNKPGFLTLSDRYAKEFPVYTDCNYCYNIIYNSVPLSLHKLFTQKDLTPFACRMDFTLESKEETKKLIHYFKQLKKSYQEPFYREFTTGHYKRGAE